MPDATAEGGIGTGRHGRLVQAALGSRSDWTQVTAGRVGASEDAPRKAAALGPIRQADPTVERNCLLVIKPVESGGYARGGAKQHNRETLSLNTLDPR